MEPPAYLLVRFISALGISDLGLQVILLAVEEVTHANEVGELGVYKGN